MSGDDPHDRLERARLAYRAANERLDAAARAWQGYVPQPGRPVSDALAGGFRAVCDEVLAAQQGQSSAVRELLDALRALPSDTKYEDGW